MALKGFNYYNTDICYLLTMERQYKAYEPQHEISNNVVYVTNKDSDQLARMHTCSLIKAFASRLNIL